MWKPCCLRGEGQLSSTLGNPGSCGNRAVFGAKVKEVDIDSHDVVIDIKACALTPHKACIDLIQKASDLQHPVGYEIAGVVSNAGSEVTMASIGDRVAVKLPNRVGFNEAAAVIGDGLRAYTALHYQGRICGGDTVLILDGALHWANLAIQLAHSWGAKVLTTASTKDEKFMLEEMKPAPTQVIEMDEKNNMLLSSVMEETGALGVDILVDNGVRLFQSEEDIELMGEKYTNPVPSKHQLLACLAVGGRWVTSHHNLQLDPPDSQQLFLRGAGISFLFEHVWSLSGAQYGRFQHILKDVIDKLAANVIKPSITKLISLDETVELLPTLSKQRVGKVVVQM